MSLQSRLAPLITAIGADIKALQAASGGSGAGDMILAIAQTVTGVKTFNSGTLLMKNAAGTVTGEPYSDANPPDSLMVTANAGVIPTPTTGLAVLSTPTGKYLNLKDSTGTTYPVDMSWENCPFASSGALTVKVGTSRYPIKGGTFQIQTIAAMVNTAPTGAAAIVDVNKNGTSIYGTQSSRPTIAIGATSATVGAHTATTVVDGDFLTVDIDQIGSTVAGSDLVVIIRMQRIA